ncbi:MAG: hypothetical protein ACFFG0_46685 [Candidatus Thorarchaeota archaeon]
MVRTIVNNKNNYIRSISIRKALRYSRCSKNIYYGRDRRNKITSAATTVTTVTAVPTMIEQEIQKIDNLKVQDPIKSIGEK